MYSQLILSRTPRHLDKDGEMDNTSCPYYGDNIPCLNSKYLEDAPSHDRGEGTQDGAWGGEESKSLK